MKKFKLTVAQPCHEDWNNMTPDQQGRFCASCQKTVVDFTNMSDRQVLEYFKKPTDSLCGRFHNDQLNRPFVSPKKRLPWVKYFFQFTWPAFVLFLKSCGQKTEIVGAIAMKEERTTDTIATMGFVLPEITPVDTVKQEVIEMPNIVGDVSYVVMKDNKCTDAVMPTDSSESIATIKSAESDSALSASFKMDTTVFTYDVDDTAKFFTTTGFVVCSKADEPEKRTMTKVHQDTELARAEFSIYPNPINVGQRLKVNVPQKISGYFQVLSVSGQVMHFGKINLDAKQTFEIEIKSWPAGNYILQLVDGSTGKSSTQKFIIQ